MLHRLLTAADSSAVNQQPQDKQSLKQTQQTDSDDAPPVHFPKRRDTKQDRAARRQSALVDLPATELPPIEHVAIRISETNWDLRRLFPAEDSQRDLCDFLIVGL